MNLSNLIAAASVLIGCVALGVALYAIKRANKTTSAATMVTLNEGFRSAWVRYFSASEEQKKIELAELLNLFEIACAVWAEGSVSGNAAELLREYLQSVLRLLTANEAVSNQVAQLLQDKTTFKFIKVFLRSNRTGVAVTIPLKWDEESCC